MTTTIITGTTLHSSVTLGSGNYPGPLTITNTGGIYPTGGTGGTALQISNPGTVTNAGIILGGQGTTPSSGTAHGGYGGYGVKITQGTFTNTGKVTGGTGGVGRAGSGSIASDGAGGWGVSESGGLVINSGTIFGGHGGSGVAVSGGVANGGAGNQAVYQTGGTFVNNGVLLAGSPGAATGSGAVAGSTARALTMTGGTFVNNGSISSSNKVGVDVNNGVFIDNGSVSAQYQIVTYNGGTPTLLLTSNASITNKIFAHGGTSTLGVTGTTPFTLSNIGPIFVAFYNFTFASTLSGFGLSGSGLNGNTVAGFIAGDNITLTGFAATSDSFASANNLVLKNSSGTTETIDLTGFTNTSQLRFSNDGSNTTLTANVQTISTSVTNAVTLGAGTYANAVSITNTGAVTGPAGAAGVYSANGNSTASGTAGSIAVLLNAASDTLTNSGVVTGGAGGAAANAPGGSSLNGGNGGAGGAGIALSAAGRLIMRATSPAAQAVFTATVELTVVAAASQAPAARG